MRVLLCGQVINSRTESIESYLKNKVDKLGVIGIVNPFLKAQGARRTLYIKGIKLDDKPLPVINITKHRWLLPFVFFINYYTMVKEGMKFKTRFDVFIGISCLSGLVGLTLKLFGKVEEVIYYCIDYYPQPTLLNKLTWKLDKLCVKHAMVTWDISPAIAGARKHYAKLSEGSYRRDILPMMYDKSMLHKSNTFDRYSLCFVGTLCWEQGFSLLRACLSTLINYFPCFKVNIIGSGAVAPQIQKLFQGMHMVTFHGFIKNNERMLELISHSAIGLSIWTPNSNAPYADPGKPKLYAFCGVPSIITSDTPIAEEMHERRCAIKIRYRSDEFIEGITKLLSNTDRLMEYRANAYQFAQDYTTDRVFKPVWERIKL